MSDVKLRSDEVSQKFFEWLIAMGCPTENVPALDKVEEMCRGQYYMVWRSLMEKVKPKDIVKTEKLLVFCDDIKQCQQKSAFSETKNFANVVEPEELTIWRQYNQLKEKVKDAKLKVLKERERLHQLTDKISSKLSQRNLLRKKLEDVKRRTWLLHQLEAELKDKQANLLETKTIADLICGKNEGADIENNLNKYMKCTTQHGAIALSSTLASGESEDDVITALVKSPGDALMALLHSRRAALCNDMPKPIDTKHDNHRASPRSVLANTAALHCTLELEAAKNRIHITATRERIADALDISNCLSEPSRELLVSRCEVSRGQARLQSLRGCSRHLAAKMEGVGIPHTAGGNLNKIDADILSKRDVLKRLIDSTAAIERKTVNARDCLVALFNSFHEDGVKNDRFVGRSSVPQPSISAPVQFYPERIEKIKNMAQSMDSDVSSFNDGAGRSLPQGTISALYQFYSEKCKKRDKVQLSMDLDASESFTDNTENCIPKFSDELKIYLKKFKLENNRKIVMESGEKIWIFETVQSSLDRIYTSWQNDTVITSFLCPSVSLKQNLKQLSQEIDQLNLLECLLRSLERDGKNSFGFNIDITPQIIEEQKILDKIKKRLNDNILNLKKTNKTLNIGVENLQFWSANEMKKYISDKRLVEGKIYREYENAYSEYLSLYK